jgi:hypothetical protein
MEQSKMVSVCPPSVAHAVRRSFRSTSATSPDLKLTTIFADCCSRHAMEDTAPCSVLIMCIGLALDTFHMRMTPWRSLAVTKVPGMESTHLHADNPVGCFANSMIWLGFSPDFPLNKPCKPHSVAVQVAFEKQTSKTVFPLYRCKGQAGFKLWVKLDSTCTAPPQRDAAPRRRDEQVILRLVAAQVVYERHILKPFFHLIGARVETTWVPGAFQLWGRGSQRAPPHRLGVEPQVHDL